MSSEQISRRRADPARRHAPARQNGRTERRRRSVPRASSRAHEQSLLEIVVASGSASTARTATSLAASSSPLPTATIDRSGCANSRNATWTRLRHDDRPFVVLELRSKRTGVGVARRSRPAPSAAGAGFRAGRSGRQESQRCATRTRSRIKPDEVPFEWRCTQATCRLRTRDRCLVLGSTTTG